MAGNSWNEGDYEGHSHRLIQDHSNRGNFTQDFGLDLCMILTSEFNGHGRKIFSYVEYCLKNANWRDNMPDNNQILLEELIIQEKEDSGEPGSINQFFEFYTASQILKKYELSYDEIEAGICGDSLDGGADSIYLFVNGDLILNP